jgi:hypothetical protein
MTLEGSNTAESRPKSLEKTDDVTGTGECARCGCHKVRNLYCAKNNFNRETTHACLFITDASANIEKFQLPLDY